MIVGVKGSKMNKSEHCKEVYAYFGLAIYNAQCVESSIIQMLIFCDLYEKEAKKNQSQTKWETKFDEFDQQLSAKTMGRLIGHLKSLNVINSDTEGLLAIALKKRNFLAHQYFPERARDFVNHLGREKMITELSEMVDFFDKIQNILNPLTMKIAEKYGLTEQIVEEIVAKEKEFAQFDL
jgi:hypothetical protein